MLTPVGQWSRLENLTFINAYLENALIRMGFFESELYSALSLTYEVSELEELDCLEEDLSGWDRAEEDLANPLKDGEIERRLNMIREVKVVMGTEDMRSYCLEGLKGSSILSRTTVVVSARA